MARREHGISSIAIISALAITATSCGRSEFAFSTTNGSQYSQDPPTHGCAVKWVKKNFQIRDLTANEAGSLGGGFIALNQGNDSVDGIPVVNNGKVGFAIDLNGLPASILKLGDVKLTLQLSKKSSDKKLGSEELCFLNVGGETACSGEYFSNQELRDYYSGSGSVRYGRPELSVASLLNGSNVSLEDLLSQSSIYVSVSDDVRVVYGKLTIEYKAEVCETQEPDPCSPTTTQPTTTTTTTTKPKPTTTTTTQPKNCYWKYPTWWHKPGCKEHKH